MTGSTTYDALNEMTTGDKSKEPTDIATGTLILYEGTLYVWRWFMGEGYHRESLKDNLNSTDEAIAAYPLQNVND